MEIKMLLPITLLKQSTYLSIVVDVVVQKTEFKIK